MRSDVKTVALVIFSALAAACTGAPRTTPPGVGTVTQPQPAPPTLVAAHNAPAASTATATASDTTTPPAGEVDPKLVKAGYSVMRRHGEVYYCRNEIITGQRIGSRICLTAGQIQDEQQNVTKAKDMMNQPSYQCLGASCSN
jgi:hypothetical protein